MEHVNKLAPMARASLPGRSEQQQKTISDFSREDKLRVKAFFMRLQTIYGAARYRASYPDQAAESSAMREWAKDILALSDQALEDRLQYAKSMMHDAAWQWPDIGLILSGGGAVSAQASLSYRSIDDIEADARNRNLPGRDCGLLPAPVNDARALEAGRSALAELMASF